MASPASDSLHDDAIVIDGLLIPKWGPEVFRAMHAGGITAANCTCSVWEEFEETMTNIARFKGWFDEHSDVIRQAYSTADVRSAKAENRVGIILGFQNVMAVGADITNLRLFHELGIRVIQMAYNTQNLVGAGCYESVDSGLTDYGRDVLAEMNRLGILADLSHVGRKTSADVIEASTKPVVYSHVCPAALHAHPRNKTDEELRFIAERGGLIGVNLLPWFLREDGQATIDDFVQAIEHTVDVAGEDHVGIGTDFMVGHGVDFLEWLRRDKGRGRLVSPLPSGGESVPEMPRGIARIEEFPNVTAAMEQRGWPEARIRKILGENWLRTFGEVWQT